jgi:hypothetical protein
MVRLDNRSAKRIFAGLLAAMAAGALLNCRLDAPRQGWSRRWGPVVPHKTFPGDCGVCHVTQRWDVLRQDFSFDHEKETGYRLEGAHAQAACLRCHNDRGPITAYLARGCGGCHADPHASTLGPDCESCHGQVNWKPMGPATRNVRKRFHRVPAHTVPPCASCHVEPGVSVPQVGPAQCGPCHEDRFAPPDRLLNAPDDADIKAPGPQMGSSHRERSVRDGQ